MREKLDSETIRRIRFVCFSGKPDSLAVDHNQYNAVVNYWKRFWSKHFMDSDGVNEINMEEFYRQDRVLCLLHGSEVVCMLLMSGYNLNCNFPGHSYFEELGAPYFEALKARNATRALSYQYFLVDENWSPRKTLVDFGAILLSLANRILRQEGYSVGIAMARKDVCVVSTLKKYGFEEIQSGKMMHNHPVSLMAGLKIKEYPKTRVTELANFYWDRRTDYTLSKKRGAHEEKNYDQFGAIV